MGTYNTNNSSNTLYCLQCREEEKFRIKLGGLVCNGCDGIIVLPSETMYIDVIRSMRNKDVKRG